MSGFFSCTCGAEDKLAELQETILALNESNMKLQGELGVTALKLTLAQNDLEELTEKLREANAELYDARDMISDMERDVEFRKECE